MLTLKTTPRIAELLEGIATIVDEGKPCCPTLYKMWENKEPIGKTLAMLKSEWIEAIGTIMFEGAATKTIRFLFNQVNDSEFTRQCLIASGEIAAEGE